MQVTFIMRHSIWWTFIVSVLFALLTWPSMIAALLAPNALSTECIYNGTINVKSAHGWKSSANRSQRDNSISNNFEQWVHELTVPAQSHSNSIDGKLSPLNDEKDTLSSFNMQKPKSSWINHSKYSTFVSPYEAKGKDSPPVRVLQPTWTSNAQSFSKLPNRVYRPMTGNSFSSRLFKPANRRTFRPDQQTQRNSFSNPISGASEPYLYSSDFAYTSPYLSNSIESYDAPSHASSSLMMPHVSGAEMMANSFAESIGGWMPQPILHEEPLVYPVKVATLPIPTAYAPLPVPAPAVKYRQNEHHSTSHHSTSHHSPSHHHHPHVNSHHHFPHDHHHHHLPPPLPLLHLPHHHHEIPWPVMMAIALPILVAALLLPLSLLFLGNFYFLTHFVRQSLLPLLGGGSSNDDPVEDDDQESKAKRSRRSFDPNEIRLRWLKADIKHRWSKHDTTWRSRQSSKRQYASTSAKEFSSIPSNLRSLTKRTIALLFAAIQKYDTI